MDRTADAVAELEEAIRINPNFVDARLALSFALRQQGNESEAVSQLDEVLRVDPGNVVALAEKKAIGLDKPSTGKQGDR